MPNRKILLIANTAWNFWNYRQAFIRALEQTGAQVILSAPEDNYSARLTGRPTIRFIPLRRMSRRSLSPFQNFRSFCELYRLFQKEQPDMVFLYTIKPNLLGNIAARMTHTLAISVVEGLGSSGSAATLWRRLVAPAFRLALHRTHRVVFLNKDDARSFLQRRLIRSNQVSIIPGPGVDTEYFKPVPKPAGPEVVFLFCGRLLREKGINEYVKAAQMVGKNHPNAVFQILGSPDSGNPTSVPAGEIKNWKRNTNLHITDRVDDVRPHLAAADVLVLPSYYREGVPRSVLEAMSMEKIILTTDTPGCRDTVDEGENGYLMPTQNTEALAACMQRVLELPPEKRLEMGRKSRRKVVAQFSDKMVLPLYLELLETIDQP
ncbi:MAG: glycosyltransferase family 4 protein [Saprospirales bacterium]|nr:glycosyltransferase family 4 protein [Saprospirales bacterium]